jgi:hypothetical protein
VFPLTAVGPLGLVHLPRQERASLDPDFRSGTPRSAGARGRPGFCSPARVSLACRAGHSISSVFVRSRRSPRWLARPHFCVLGLEQISFFRFGSCFLRRFPVRL